MLYKTNNNLENVNGGNPDFKFCAVNDVTGEECFDRDYSSLDELIEDVKNYCKSCNAICTIPWWIGYINGDNEEIICSGKLKAVTLQDPATGVKSVNWEKGCDLESVRNLFIKYNINKVIKN